MKKIIAVLLSVMLALGMSAVAASAAETFDVYVTVCDEQGAVPVAAQQITVSDIDADGALTINDALILAHDKFYEGGSAAGYATSVTQYGLGITKLWGSTIGSYGYYVNNNSAWSLEDPIKANDYIAAFVYTDPAWSDHYSYFDRFLGDINADEEFTLTYSEAGYDEQWNPVVLPVEGAVITVDGEKTTFTTDAEGKASVKLSTNGVHTVSAVKDGRILVAPVFIATVTGAVESTETPTAVATPDQAKTSISSNTNAVKTDAPSTGLFLLFGVMILALSAAIIFKKHEA
jgi:hypothetical protein